MIDTRQRFIEMLKDHGYTEEQVVRPNVTKLVDALVYAIEETTVEQKIPKVGSEWVYKGESTQGLENGKTYTIFSAASQEFYTASQFKPHLTCEVVLKSEYGYLYNYWLGKFHENFEEKPAKESSIDLTSDLCYHEYHSVELFTSTVEECKLCGKIK